MTKKFGARKARAPLTVRGKWEEHLHNNNKCNNNNNNENRADAKQAEEGQRKESAAPPPLPPASARKRAALAHHLVKAHVDRVAPVWAAGEAQSARGPATAPKTRAQRASRGAGTAHGHWRTAKMSIHTLTWWRVFLDILAQVPAETSFLLVGSCYGSDHTPDSPLLVASGKWCLHGYALRPRGARLLMHQVRHAVHTGSKERSDWARVRRFHNVRAKVTSGMRVPVDFITLVYSHPWLNGLAVNLKRAVADGLVYDPFQANPHSRWGFGGKPCLTAECIEKGYERFGGIIGQDPGIRSTIHGE